MPAIIVAPEVAPAPLAFAPILILLLAFPAVDVFVLRFRRSGR